MIYFSYGYSTAPVFLAVARLRHFTQAAEELRVAQGAFTADTPA
jgi:hypothetical protein